MWRREMGTCTLSRAHKQQDFIQLVFITLFSLGLTELVVLCTGDVFAVAGGTVGAPPGCVWSLQGPWDTLHPEPRLQKTGLNCSVHVNIMIAKHTLMEGHT